MFMLLDVRGAQRVVSKIWTYDLWSQGQIRSRLVPRLVMTPIELQ
jgi:hypothetical protein